jgi:hypothetical protein
MEKNCRVRYFKIFRSLNYYYNLGFNYNFGFDYNLGSNRSPDSDCNLGSDHSLVVGPEERNQLIRRILELVGRLLVVVGVGNLDFDYTLGFNHILAVDNPNLRSPKLELVDKLVELDNHPVLGLVRSLH